jgi:Cys-tRNA(Pro)/Cys-tRNA(Cys) deacylase
MAKLMSKTNALRLAECADLAFEAFEYDISDGKIDGVSIANKIGKSTDEVFKTLVTEAPGHEYFVFIVPAGANLDLKKAAAVVKRKSIEMIAQKELLPLTGYVHGGCSPLGMKKLFPTVIDETALLFDRICVSGGKVGLNIAVEPEALAKVINAVFYDIVK